MEKPKNAPVGSPDTTLPPGTRIGGYTLARKISEGGMGEVYEGVQRALKRRVAVKLLANWAVGRADLRARFLREGETAARIRHHNIVEIYDVGVWGERPYIVMEYLEGRTLEEIMQLDGAMPESDVADLMLPVMSAVGAANDRGIIHRDIKPENVFIAEMDSGVEPKVLDFGISRVVTSHERLAIDAQNLGTPHYMSPEQARGESVDGRSDQYSIAIVIYEMVTGRLPRDHEVTVKLMHMVAHEGFTHPRDYAPGLSDTMVDALMRALSADPGDRFDDLQDMMRALVPIASDRARNYWERELTDFEDLGRVASRPPASGSQKAIVAPTVVGGAPAMSSSDDETQDEILLQSPAHDEVVADDEDEKKPVPWMFIGAAAVVLLAFLAWQFVPGDDDGDIELTDESAAPSAPPIESPTTVEPSEEVAVAPAVEAEVVPEVETPPEEAEPPAEEPVAEAVAAVERPRERTWRPLDRRQRANMNAAMNTMMNESASAEMEPAQADPTPPPVMRVAPTEMTWEPEATSDNVDPWN